MPKKVLLAIGLSVAFFFVGVTIVMSIYTLTTRKPCVPSLVSPDSILTEPQFIRSWNIYQDTLSITLDQFVIWEPSEFDGDTFHRVQKTITVEADGNVVSIPRNELFEFTTMIIRYDEQDGAIGSHGGELMVRLPIDFEPNTVAVGIQTLNGMCLVNTIHANK